MTGITDITTIILMMTIRIRILGSTEALAWTINSKVHRSMYPLTGNLHLNSGTADFMETGEDLASAIPFNIYPYTIFNKKGRGRFSAPFLYQRFFKPPLCVPMCTMCTIHDLRSGQVVVNTSTIKPQPLFHGSRKLRELSSFNEKAVKLCNLPENIMLVSCCL